MLLRKLLRTAWNYKSQFISMIVMIVIGIGVFSGFNIEWKSIEEDTSTFFEDTNYADYRLYSSSGFTLGDIAEIRSIDGVNKATRYLSVNVAVKGSDTTVTLNVSEDYSVSTMLVTDGAEYDENLDGVWFSDRFAEKNGIKIGDETVFVYQGKEINGKVVGLCKSGENMICVADENQLMPDYGVHGFAYISPKTLENALGAAFYSQINVVSDMEKANLEEEVKVKLGRTVQVVDKSLHSAYAGALSEAEEGKTMGSILPVLFLAIAVLTMVTTMHRIAANEKVQIGTLKALGFRDRRILLHYTSYGLFIGLVGSIVGVLLGYGIAALIISPSGMMSTYFDLPSWNLVMPAFVVPVVVLTVMFLTLVSFLSVKKMLVGTAADTLRPYTSRTIKKSKSEKIPFVKKLPFSLKWNLRDVLRHKARSAMTLIGVFGCTLLVVGGLGMADTMHKFIGMLDDTNNYATKINVAETASDEEVLSLAETLNGDWQADAGISYNGDTLTLEVYCLKNGKIRFLSEDNEIIKLENDGVYLCLRLKDTANVGDTVEFSPYGDDKTYTVTVAGYFRSPVTKSIVMSDVYAEKIGYEYRITSVYTDAPINDVAASPVVSSKQAKDTVMATYETFMRLMNLMVAILIIAAIVLGIVVLYNLGVMSYLERKRELSTLKVLGFRDKSIGKLLISQNIWLTLSGAIIGLPGGVATLKILIVALCGEYELSLFVSAFSYIASVLITFAVSLAVGVIVARKNKRIDMVEALKFAQ